MSDVIEALKSFAGHAEASVLTQPKAGVFERRPMTPAERAARAPAMKIALDIYRHANQAGVCYLEIWRLIADAMEGLSSSEAPAKWCEYCQKDNHNDDECWCTRPGGWKPYQGTLAFIKISPSALRAADGNEAGSGAKDALPAGSGGTQAARGSTEVELTRLDCAEAAGAAPQEIARAARRWEWWRKWWVADDDLERINSLPDDAAESEASLDAAVDEAIERESL